MIFSSPSFSRVYRRGPQLMQLFTGSGQDTPKLKVISCFSGIMALELGLREPGALTMFFYRQLRCMEAVSCACPPASSLSSGPLRLNATATAGT